MQCDRSFKLVFPNPPRGGINRDSQDDSRIGADRGRSANTHPAQHPGLSCASLLIGPEAEVLCRIWATVRPQVNASDIAKVALGPREYALLTDDNPEHHLTDWETLHRTLDPRRHGHTPAPSTHPRAPYFSLMLDRKA